MVRKESFITIKSVIKIVWLSYNEYIINIDIYKK